MDKFKIDFKEEIPKYIQLQKHIKKLVDKDEIKDGEKLPPIRNLSKFLGVNNVTVVSAYKKLEQEGYALQKMGSGTYAKRKDIKSFKREYSKALKKVSEDELKKFIDFRGEGTSTEFFPINSFKEALNEVLDRDGAEALMYQESLGYPGLRDAINKLFWKGEREYEDILIISGAQQGIDIVSKVLVNVNDNVVIERPTYAGALTVFSWRRANIFNVNMRCDGIDIDEFENILKKNRVKCFYTMSYFQNPTGATYSKEKKEKILNLAEKYDFYIVEDDYLSELIYDNDIKYESFKSLDKNDRVIYIKSFSKIFLPGIRIGYMICPSKYRDAIQNSKISTDISTSSLMQRSLALYMERGFWKEYICEMKSEYEKRYNFMKEYLQSQLGNMVKVFIPGGGLTFFVEVNKNLNITSKDIFYKCIDNGVLITPGVMFFKEEEEGLYYFRLGYSGTNLNDIKNGIDIIKRAMEELMI